MPDAPEEIKMVNYVHREKMQEEDFGRTGGYLGTKYRINDPNSRKYMPDKIT